MNEAKRHSGGRALILIAFLMLPACVQRSPSPPWLIRLIDRLSDDHIIRSPLMQGSAPAGDSDPRYPEMSSPLAELGIPENPLLLKRRLRLGGTDRNVLFAPPDSAYGFDVDLAPDHVLEFAVGIVVDTRSAGTRSAPPPPKRGVSFRIEMEQEGRSRILFQKYLTAPDFASDPAFVYESHSLELPYDLRGVRLSLITEGEHPLFSFWGNPVLVRRNPSPRNVILISVDTLRADHLGCYGYQRDTSPRIDALAADGARFVSAYASSSWTLPSHVSLFTSLHGVHHQVYFDDERMDPKTATLAELFYARGFTCAAFTGGGFVSPAYGFAKGFESYDVGVGGVFHQDSAERVARAVSDWIDRHRDRDVFLFLHTYQPHSPYACPPPYKVMFLNEDSLFGHADLFGLLGGKENLYKPLPERERRNLIDLYDGEIRYVDDKLIGSLADQLKSRGLYDRSLIVFLSDHGEEFFDHGAWGHGQSLYDELLRVPLIFKFPRSRYRGTAPDTIVSLVDVMPTLLEAAGWSDAGGELDGRSLIPVLEGREADDRRFLAEIGGNVMDSHVPQKRAFNRGRIKLIMNDQPSREDLSFFAFPPPLTGKAELFDLAEDPHERVNAVHEQPSLANGMIRWITEFYRTARRATPRRAGIDQSVRDQLKALGYIR